VGALRIADAGDGQVEFVSTEAGEGVRNKPGTTPPSRYLYFDVDDQWAATLSGEAWVVIDFLDKGLGNWRLEYDSRDPSQDIRVRYRPAEESHGATVLNTGAWCRAVFRLRQPGFNNRQNYGMDFRLSGPRQSALRLITVVDYQPCRLEEFQVADEQRLKSLRSQGRPDDSDMELTIGNFDFSSPEELPAVLQRMEETLPLYRALGVTSDEIYVRWRAVERSKGVYSFDWYDQQVERLAKHGIKWVPFLIAGPAYTLPEWFFGSAEDVGYVCLEHNERSHIQSLWNPHLPKYVEGFVRAFADHYRPQGVIESVLLGITGNYGEAIYPATGVDWTAHVYGPYHTHSGFWAGDDYAREDFRRFLMDKYRSIGSLNRAWGTAHASFAEVEPFLRRGAPNDRAWLDMCEWYIGAMQKWADFWLAATRKAFPTEEIYLCTGGHAPAEHGSDFALQCKLAAQYGAGVRITNEASDYLLNFSLTRMVASAGKFYGAFYGFEPAGGVDERGVVNRIYNAVASGARQLHYYHGNLFDGEGALDRFLTNARFLRQRQPLVEIAAYYPQTSIRLYGNHFLDKAQRLRRHLDFDFVSDQMILDGALSRYKALVFLWGEVSEVAVLEAIAQWVEDGGIALYPLGAAAMRPVEDDGSAFTAWLQRAEPLPETPARVLRFGEGRAYFFPGEGDWLDQYCAAAAALLEQEQALLPITRAMIAAQRQAPDLFATALADGELLLLNCGQHPVVAAVGGVSVEVAPASIAALALDPAFLRP